MGSGTFRHCAVIDPAVKTAALSGFNRLAELSALRLTYHLPAFFGSDSLASEGEGLCGIVILGSATSVNDQLEWQKQLATWLKPRVLTGMPVLGICFGHQFLAHLFGGKVGYLFPDQRKLLGFRKVHFSDGRLWGNREGEIFVSHRETVIEVPNGFKVVASSSEAKVEALEHERLPIYSCQSHPETTDQFLKSLEHPVISRPGQLAFGHELIRSFFALIEKKP